MVIELTAMAPTGEAIGHAPDGRVVFVPFGIPGERVEVTLTHERRRFAYARLLRVLRASPERVEPLCPHFAHCGGCDWQHIAYAAQLRYKTEAVREQLVRLGRIPDPPVRACVPSPNPYGYRNRIQLVGAHDGHWGYRARKAHDVTPIDACAIAAPELNALLHAIPAQPGAHLDVRLSDEGAQRLSAETPVATMRVGRWRYRVPGNVFFQVNTAVAALLIEEVLRAAAPDPSAHVLDLYCGVGLFTVPLAEQAQFVLGVEVNERAARAAAENVRGLRAEIWAMDVKRALASVALQRERWDIAVLDPPRGGVDPQTLRALIRLNAWRLVYVSCEPATFARDARRLLDAGYRLEFVQPLDMFPQTRHVESVACFTRA